MKLGITDKKAFLKNLQSKTKEELDQWDTDLSYSIDVCRNRIKIEKEQLKTYILVRNGIRKYLLNQNL